MCICCQSPLPRAPGGSCSPRIWSHSLRDTTNSPSLFLTIFTCTVVLQQPLHSSENVLSFIIGWNLDWYALAFWIIFQKFLLGFCLVSNLENWTSALDGRESMGTLSCVTIWLLFFDYLNKQILRMLPHFDKALLRSSFNTFSGEKRHGKHVFRSGIPPIQRIWGGWTEMPYLKSVGNGVST